MANLVVAQLLFLSNEDPKADINMYINSPGGSVSAGLAIYDTMQFIRCPTWPPTASGMAASHGRRCCWPAGTKGKRYILPNSRVLIHQPLIRGVLTGPATELDIEAREIIRLRKRLYEILAARHRPDRRADRARLRPQQVAGRRRGRRVRRGRPGAGAGAGVRPAAQAGG